jgi:outer membrane protein assembly factor BamB
MKKIIFLLVIFTSTFSSKAQRTASSIVEFKSPIKQLIVNSSTGITYLKEDTKLSGFSNDLNKVVWVVDEKEIGAKSTLQKISEVDLAAIGRDKDVIEIIDGSDYIFANINNKDLLINGLSGEVLFNSEKDMAGFMIVKQMFLPYDNACVFLTKAKKDFILKYYDLNTKKIVWEVNAGTEASFASMFSKDQRTRVDRAESFGNNIYALANNRLYNVDRKTGKLLWTLEKINKFFICQNGKNVVIMKNEGGMMSVKKSLNIIDKDNGKPIWKDDIETRMFIALQDWNDKILIAHARGFNFYNFNDGSKVWKKDIKGSDFKQVLPLGEDFLYVAENEMILIDKNGKEKWKNSIEISDNKEDKVYYLGKTKSGKVMYITATYGNMVDYVTGKKLWKRNIKFNENRPLLYAYDEEKDVFLIYNDGDLYRFDPNINDKPEQFAKIEAKSDKTMAGIELFSWGISLTSQSEVIGVSNDGKVLFQKQYEQPGESARQLLNVTGNIAEGYLGSRGSLKKGLADATVTVTYVDDKGKTHERASYLFTENTRAKIHDSGNKDLANAALVGELTKNFSQRFNALKQNSEYAFIFAKDKSGNANLKVLVKVSKQNGKELDKIIVENDQPLYDVDASTDVIYYAKGNKLMIFK